MRKSRDTYYIREVAPVSLKLIGSSVPDGETPINQAPLAAA
jgi:hypothetical protein